MEDGSNHENESQSRFLELADELESVIQKGDVVLARIVELLRNGNAEHAKYIILNQCDKFTGYPTDIRMVIIEKLYHGKDSPWPFLEEKS